MNWMRYFALSIKHFGSCQILWRPAVLSQEDLAGEISGYFDLWHVRFGTFCSQDRFQSFIFNWAAFGMEKRRNKQATTTCAENSAQGKWSDKKSVFFLKQFWVLKEISSTLHLTRNQTKPHGKQWIKTGSCKMIGCEEIHPVQILRKENGAPVLVSSQGLLFGWWKRPSGPPFDMVYDRGLL